MTEEQVKPLTPTTPAGNPGAVEERLDLILRELRMLRKELRRASAVPSGLPKKPREAAR